MTNTINEMYVHAGTFHADDVFAVALMKEVTIIKVNRVFKVTEDAINAAASGRAIIADIGRQYDPEKGLYDHHQEECPRRENGGKYASFGLMLRQFKNEIWFDAIDRIAAQIDACDNGEAPCVLSTMIHAQNPTWDSTSNGDVEFASAVEIARLMLRGIMEHERSKAAAENLIYSAPINEGVLVLPQYAPWQEYVNNINAKAVVWPSNRGGYNCQIKPVEPGSFDRVGDFSGITAGENGCTFVHAAGFLAAFETQDAAIAAGKAVKLK